MITAGAGAVDAEVDFDVDADADSELCASAASVVATMVVGIKDPIERGSGRDLSGMRRAKGKDTGKRRYLDGVYGSVTSMMNFSVGFITLV